MSVWESDFNHRRSSSQFADWLASNIQTVSFVYAFSWITILSSVLSYLLLGRGRSVLVQYVVCLVLTSIALSSSQIPIIRGYVESIIGFSVYLGEPVSAVVYLLTPFVLMLVIDVRGGGCGPRERWRSQWNRAFDRSIWLLYLGDSVVNSLGCFSHG
jgi:hypothetical protein